MPFITEEIWQIIAALNNKKATSSIMLAEPSMMWRFSILKWRNSSSPLLFLPEDFDPIFRYIQS